MSEYPIDSLGLRSAFLLRRIGQLKTELAKIAKETSRHKMGLASENVKRAAECLQSAEKTWNPEIRW